MLFRDESRHLVYTRTRTYCVGALRRGAECTANSDCSGQRGLLQTSRFWMCAVFPGGPIEQSDPCHFQLNQVLWTLVSVTTRV